MILASRNAHKLVEVRQILGREDIDLSPGNLGDPVEDDVTFAGNALIKARYVAERTGEAVIADDSGLCVDVLGGSPGVFSARWCGRHGADDENTDLLLGQLNDVGDDLRQAKFVCAAVYVSPGQPDIIATGIMPGRLDPGTPRQGRFRLRPDLRTRRIRTDRGRTDEPGEELNLPPRTSLPGTEGRDDKVRDRINTSGASASCAAPPRVKQARSQKSVQRRGPVRNELVPPVYCLAV